MVDQSKYKRRHFDVRVQIFQVNGCMNETNCRTMFPLNVISVKIWYFTDWNSGGGEFRIRLNFFSFHLLSMRVHLSLRIFLSSHHSKWENAFNRIMFMQFNRKHKKAFCQTSNVIACGEVQRNQEFSADNSDIFHDLTISIYCQNQIECWYINWNLPFEFEMIIILNEIKKKEISFQILFYFLIEASIDWKTWKDCISIFTGSGQFSATERPIGASQEIHRSSDWYKLWYSSSFG